MAVLIPVASRGLRYHLVVTPPSSRPQRQGAPDDPPIGAREPADEESTWSSAAALLGLRALLVIVGLGALLIGLGAAVTP